MTPDDFRQHRLRLGLSQSQLASVLGIHTVSISRYETGARSIPEPTARFLQSLSRKDVQEDR